MKKGPERTCVGCRQLRSKGDLLRLVRGEDGRARLDPNGRDPGRGAYVCAAIGCLTRAFGKRGLSHAFRQPTRPPAEPPERLLAAFEARRRVPGCVAGT